MRSVVEVDNISASTIRRSLTGVTPSDRQKLRISLRVAALPKDNCGNTNVDRVKCQR